MENNLRILHPFMPFLSEDIWQQISERSPEEALIVNHWPEVNSLNQADLLAGFEWAKQVISEVRTVRKEKQIAQKEVLDMFVMHPSNPLIYWTAGIEKLANLRPLQLTDAPIEGALSFRVDAHEYFIPIAGAIDVDAEIAKVTEELTYTKGFLTSVEKKLSNERFVSNAPEAVLALEKKKQSDAIAKIETLEQSLVYLKG